jgi:PAS domain S-box-containing protein
MRLQLQKFFGGFSGARKPPETTDHLQVEAALRQSEQRFRMLRDNLGEGVVVQDSDWRYTYANPAAHAIVAWPPGTLIGANEQAILSPSGRAICQQHNLRRLQGEISSYEVDLVRPNGEARTIIATGVPRLNEQGQLAETLVTFTDITERKQAEATLQRYAERLEMLHEIDRSLLTAHSLQDTAKAALIRIRPLVPCLRTSVTLFDFEKNEASFLAADFDGLQTIPDTPVPVED